MGHEVIVLASIALVFSLIIIWMTTQSMIKIKRFLEFLPFLLLGISLSFYSAFVLFEFFFQWGWVFLELTIFLSLLWIFVNLLGGQKC
jgi:hypothetical protein